MSLSSGDEVPHIFTRKSRLRPKEFLITSAKRLLQQNRHKAPLAIGQGDVRSARILQTSTCSAMASASSTSIPRYRTVLSIFLWPSGREL